MMPLIPHSTYMYHSAPHSSSHYVTPSTHRRQATPSQSMQGGQGSFLIITDSEVFTSDSVSCDCVEYEDGDVRFKVDLNVRDKAHEVDIKWDSTERRCVRQKKLAMQYLTRRIVRGEPIVLKELVNYIKANQGN